MSAPTLPATSDESTLLVRTAFDDDPGWSSLSEAAATPSSEGFLANLRVVDDRAYAGHAPEDLRALLPPDQYVSFFFLADETAIHDPEHPVLVVPVAQPATPFLDEPPRPSFRVVVAGLWAVENNLSLGNMDWDDFAGHCDRGVFRDL